MMWNRRHILIRKKEIISDISTPEVYCVFVKYKYIEVETVHSLSVGVSR